MEPTKEEARLQRQLWDLKTSEKYGDGDKRTHERVARLEGLLKDSRWEGMSPTQKFDSKVQEALDED